MKTIEQYRDLISRTERLQATHPLWYKMRVAAFALLGIAYVLAMALLAIALGIGLGVVLILTKALVALKVAWVPIAFGLFLLKAMWVRIPAPTGRLVERAQAPRLFAEIDDVRSAVNAPGVHAVVLTPEFNAAIAQVPRLGILGWPKHYLILGLPLLASVPLEQFRAVLAHEFGHLARNHARFGNWIYRVRRTWYQLLTALEAHRSAASGLFIRFFNWYAPYFEAYSFVLARANEYVADSESARVAGKEHAARALVSVYCKSAYADCGFWEAFYRPAAERPDPPTAAFASFLSELQSVDGAPLQDALKVALKRKTDLHDTHPCLADRLAALGESVRGPAPVTQSAVEVLLGSLAQEVIAEQDQAWRESIARNWQQRHQRFQEALERKTKFEALMQERGLTPQENLEYALSLDLLNESQAALPLLDEVIAAEPDNADAWYLRGRIRLADGNDDGVGDLDRAMELDEQATAAACQALYRYLEQRDELRRFEPYRARYHAFQQKQNEAMTERRCVSTKDGFSSHGLNAAQLQTIAAVVSEHKTLRHAWLARKQLMHYPQNPLYILIVEGCGIEQLPKATLESVAKSIPAGMACYVINKAGNDGIYSKVKRLPDAMIYER